MTSVEQYQASTESLAAQAQAQALAVYTAYQAGQITRDQALALIVTVINQSNAAAVALADAGLSVQIEQVTGSLRPPPASPQEITPSASRRL